MATTIVTMVTTLTVATTLTMLWQETRQCPCQRGLIPTTRLLKTESAAGLWQETSHHAVCVWQHNSLTHFVVSWYLRTVNKCNDKSQQVSSEHATHFLDSTVMTSPTLSDSQSESSVLLHAFVTQTRAGFICNHHHHAHNNNANLHFNSGTPSNVWFLFFIPTYL